MLLHRPLREEQRLRDGGVVLPLGHLPQHLSFALRKLPQDGVRLPVLPGNQPFHDSRVQNGSAPGDVVERPYKLFEITDALLQQVPEPLGTVLEQVVRIVFFGVLRKDDHADLRMLRSNPLGCVDALGRVRRRHSNVRQDDIGKLLLHRSQKLVEVGGRRHQVDILDACKEGRCTLPDEVVVLGEHNAQRHERIV